MKYRMRKRRFPLVLWTLIAAVMLTACNLNTNPQGNSESPIEQITEVGQAQATRTLQSGVIVPTGRATLTPIPFSTPIPQQGVQPTSVAVVPPSIISRPTSTSLPFSIVIVSPSPGNVVSGSVQVVGSAIHPSFLQYRLEYGPDPNPSNLWFPVTGIVQAPILASSLGIWNTNTAGTPDGVYQLRLRVFLLDGSIQTTNVGGIRVRNQQPTPIPTNTPTIPRPTASFTQDISTGETPLVVRFQDRSQGQISSYSWDFGDGGSSSSRNPTYTYATPGVYTVTLRVDGPGGSANVSNQITVQSPNAPDAAFDPSVTSGEAPLIVNFANQSTGQIDSVMWDFGDGTESTESNVSHTFSATGTYNVILRVEGPGGSDVEVQPIIVENPAIPAPVAGFTANPTSGETSLTVVFANTTTGDVSQYLWDFNGDGITDNTDIDPTHIYTEAGTYEVRLLAIGEGGRSEAFVTITVEDPPDAPSAGFTANPTSGEAPLTVVFTNTTTGDVTDYVWDFDSDGQPDSTETNPQFTYQSPGTYTVTLIANGNGGASSPITDTITVQQPPEPPTAAFLADPTAGQAPLLVQFTNQSEGTQLTYAWDFDGDSVTDSSDPSPAFEYTIPGNYTVTLAITDPNNLSATATATINVSEAVVIQPPTAAFMTDIASGSAPLTVTFTNQSIGDITNYEWDFQTDGVIDSTDVNPTFAFTVPGTYIVSLTAIGTGGSNTISSTIEVTEALATPIAAFNPSTLEGTAPLNVTFTDASQGTIDSYAWDVNGDGIADSTEQNPSFVFDVAGTYNVTLTVSNAAGSDSLTQPITVTEALAPPIAAFNPSTLEGTAPLNVTFTDASQGTIDSYVWDVNGDGIADSTEQNPSFVFDVAGTYNVTLTVSNAAGSDSLTQAIIVTDPVPEIPAPPIANFTLSVTEGTAPLNVTFTDTSQGVVDNYAWDFQSDGVADSAEQNPSFVFDIAGTYNVTLTVSNAAGSDSLTQAITVTEALSPPIANFTLSVTEGTAPLSATFTDTSQGVIDSYAWDVNGDGIADSTEQNPTFTFDVAGTYNVTLTISNAAGSDSLTQTITVTEALAPPIANFSPSTLEGTTPLTVSFVDTSQGVIDSYAWDFQSDGVADSAEQNPSFVFDVAGTYNVTLTVSNATGSDSITQTIVVTDPVPEEPPVVAPVSNFTPSATEGTAPLSVTFTDTSQGVIDSYAWDFNGDGVTDSAEQSPSFVFDIAGTYNVTLTVSNVGGSAVATQTITVSDPVVEPPAPALPTGAIVVVSDRDGNNELYVIEVNGTNPVNITNNAANDRQPAWSPDGSRVAFVSDRDGNNEIYVLRLDDLSVTRLTDNGANDQQPVWSPDGSQIAFVSDRTGNNDIYTMASNGQNVVAITTDAANDQQPDWGGNGLLLFVSDRFGDNDIFTVVPGDISTLQQLTTATANDQNPTWSPDNNQIVFISNRTLDSDALIDNNIFIMAADGSNAVPINADVSTEFDPDWR